MSNLVDHARRELELCGQTASDPKFAASIVAAVEAFASYGHSGGSAQAGIFMLSDLLNFRNLSPLTDDPNEWLDHTSITGSLLWQSKRNPAAFSTDRGVTYTLTSDQPGTPARPTVSYKSKETSR